MEFDEAHGCETMEATSADFGAHEMHSHLGASVERGVPHNGGFRSAAEQWLAAGCKELMSGGLREDEYPQNCQAGSELWGVSEASLPIESQQGDSPWQGEAEFTQGVPGSDYVWDIIAMYGPPPCGACWETGETAPVCPASDMAVWHTTHYKKRLCASFPRVSQCRHGAQCTFAHSRAELQSPALSAGEEQHDPRALTADFFLYKFKTLWCPIGVQHDWQACVYAHNYQDVRRDASIGYGPVPCPHWNRHNTTADYLQRCPWGLRCPYSHGAKEVLYHPEQFRTVSCKDHYMNSRGCSQRKFCAFFHTKLERRKPSSTFVDYQRPLPVENISTMWADAFLAPPFPGGAQLTGPAGLNYLWHPYVRAYAGPPPSWRYNSASGKDMMNSPTTQSTASGSDYNGGELMSHDDALIVAWSEEL